MLNVLSVDILIVIVLIAGAGDIASLLIKILHA